MNDSTSLWTWRNDLAISQATLRPWVAVTFFSYIVGAALLVGAMAFRLPQQLATAGALLIVVAVVAAAGVTGKVLVNRGRTA